jgi:hypothetical protein
MTKTMSHNEYSQLSQNIINLERNLNHTSWEKVLKALTKFDCAMIPLAQLHDDVLVGIDGLQKGQKPIDFFRYVIMYSGFGISSICGTSVGRLLSRNIEGVNVNTVLVFNFFNNPEFTDRLRKIGKIFNDDSIIILEKDDGSNYRLGTGLTTDFPDGVKIPLMRFQDSINEQFEVIPEDGRIYLETFRQYQNNTKYLISRSIKPIIDLLK